MRLLHTAWVVIEEPKAKCKGLVIPHRCDCEKKREKNPHASSLRRVATEMSLDPLRSDAEWLDEAKTVDCILFISPSLLRPGGDSWTWGRLSECACRIFHMRRWGRVGTEKMDKQDKE